jgi:putative ABC transport system permease protein
MKYKEVIKTAWKSLLSNKLRSLLTMLGVIIGVAAVIIMIAISTGTELTISEAINGLGSNLIFINPAFNRGGPGGPENQRGGLVFKDVDAIRQQISGIAGVSVEQGTDVTIKYGSTTLEEIGMVGTTTDYTTVRNIQVGSGRYFNESEMDTAAKVVVLGAGVAEELFGKNDPAGEAISVNNIKLTVIGVMAKKGIVSGTNFDQMIYSPITLVFKKFTPNEFARFRGDRVRSIYVSVKDAAKMDDVIQQISLLLAARHKVTLAAPDFNISTQEDIIQTRESTTQSFRTLLAWVAGVSLIVGGIGIMNIMLVSVTERTREIGIRQAVGATPGDIQIQFLAEALILSLMGGVIGVLAGIGGSYLFGSLSGMRSVIAPYSLVLSFSSSAIIGIVFGYLPAQKAAQMDPIESLRHE